MICGLGCDLCAIPRMADHIKDGRFLLRYFTAEERAYIAARTRSAQTAAGIFAAKEALVKALGTGFVALSPADVAIGHDAQGAPKYILNEKTRAALQARGAARAFLSISHDGDYALATAVLEGENHASSD